MTIHLDSSAWVARGLPGLSLWDPASLSDADLAALYRFRRRYVDLKPTTDPDDDAAAFTAFFRTATDAWIWLRRGEVVGIGAHRTASIDFDGMRRTYTWSDYGFIAKRGRPLPMLSQAFVYARSSATRLGPAYILGFCYPQSFVAFAETTSTVWLLGEPDLPRHELDLATHLAANLGASRWDPISRHYDFPTLPRERVSTRAPRRAELLARYEAVNPEWRTGRGAFMFARLDLATFADVLATMGRRSVRLFDKSHEIPTTKA